MDLNGKPCRAADAYLTVVHRESPWDNESQARAMRLIEHEDSLCPCGCGHPVAVAHDPDRYWFVDDFTCYAERAREGERRKKRDQAKDANRPDGWDDGLHYTVRPYDPDRDPEPKKPRRPRRGKRADND